MVRARRGLRETNGSPHGGLFVAVLDLIARLAADDAVIVGVEDLHWADTVTWDLFEYLARNLIDEQVVLVGTYRANEVAIHPSQRRRLGELSRLPAAHRLDLEGLDRDEIAERVRRARRACTERARRPGARARSRKPVLHERARRRAPVRRGHPDGAVRSDLRRDRRSRRRLARCWGRSRRSAARPATSSLAAVIDLPAPRLEAAVRTVIDARMLVVDNEAYRFRHPLLGEVVYADLLPPQRARLHRRIADTLQQQPADVLRRADRAGELAFHLDRSGDSEEAFYALLAAADAAETIAPGAAFGHLERAFELWDSVGERSAAVNRGDRLWQAADLATSTVGNQRAVELARAAFELGPPPLGAAFGHERSGATCGPAGGSHESRVEFERAAATAERRRGHRRCAGVRRSRSSRADGGRRRDGRTMVRQGVRPVPTRRRHPSAWVWRAVCSVSSAATRATRPKRSNCAARPLPQPPARKVARWPRCTCASHSSTPVTIRPRSTRRSTPSRRDSSPASIAASVATSTRSPPKR